MPPNDEPMNDARLVLPPEPGIAYKLLSVKDARPHYATVTFTALDPKLPEIGSWRAMFPSRSLAEEFSRSLAGDALPTGSPKQYRLKLAAKRRLRPDQLDLYQYHVTITEVPQDDQRAPRVPGAFARKPARPSDPSPASSGPVPSGPVIPDGGGPDLLSSVLSDEEIRALDSGTTPESGSFKSWSET